MEHGQPASNQPLKKTESSPHSPHHQKISTVGSYTSASLSTILMTLFYSFLAGLFLVRGVVMEVFMSPILIYESAVIDITAKETSLSMAASSNMDHEHQHVSLQQQGPGMPTRPPVAARITEIFQIGRKMKHSSSQLSCCSESG